MEIRIFDREDALAVYAADLIQRVVENRARPVLGLATGSSPVSTYRELVRRYREEGLSFSAVTTFNLDEYCGLPPEDKNSYFYFMREHLFGHIDIDPKNVHIENGCAPDPDAEVRAYDALLRELGPVDLQLLGIGTNGHIGFNEPADAFTEGTFRIRLSDSTVRSNSRYFTDGKMPEYALTMGVGSIMSAKKIVLIARGGSKANAIRATVKGEVTPRCPASILQTHPDAVLLLDRAAAALL